MTLQRLTLFGAVLFVIGFAAVGGAQQPVPPEPYNLPPVVVTPTGTPQSEMATSRSVSVVGSEERAKQQSRSLPEALSESAGVHVQQTNRGAGAPIIRGLVGPQNLILVDGVRFNSSVFRTGPNQYAALMDPYLLDRIEVMRGPSSVLYGNGAMGGVLQIMMPRASPEGGEFRWNGQAIGRFVSSDLSGGGTVAASGSVGAFAFHVGGSYDHMGALRVGGGKEWPLSAYDAGYWQSQFAFEQDAWSVRAAYYGTLMRDAGRTDKLGLGEAREYDNDDHLAYLRFNWSPGGTFEELRLTASIRHLEEVVDRYQCETSIEGLVLDRARCAALEPGVLTKQRQNIDQVTAYGAELLQRLSFWNRRVRTALGGAFYYDVVSSRRDDMPGQRGNFSDGSTYLDVGAFAHTEIDLFTSEGFVFTLEGGVRYALFQALAPDVPDLGDVDYSHGDLVGAAALRFIWPELLTAYIDFSQGFRAPNLQETTVLGDTGNSFEIPNPDLQPERSDTVEVGAKLALASLTLRAAYFASFLQDPIDVRAAFYQGEAEIDGDPVRQRVNAEGGFFQGVEGAVSVGFWRLSLGSSLTWTDTELEGEGGTTHVARRMPPLQGNVFFRYEQPDTVAYAELFVRWAAAQEQLHPGDRKDLRICETETHSGVLQADCEGTPGYVTLGVRGGWEFVDGLRVDLSVDNILDANYRVHGSGLDGAGVDARLSFSARF